MDGAAGENAGRHPRSPAIRWSPDGASVGSAERRELTTREREVAGHVVSGMDNEQIARLLGVSRRTVEFHLSNVYRKLGIFRRGQLHDAMAAAWPCASCERAIVRAVDRVLRSGAVVDGILGCVSTTVAAELAKELAEEKTARAG